MNIIYFLLPLALLLAGLFAVAFIVTVVRGQYDDLETPAYKILLTEETQSPARKGNMREHP